MTILFSVITQKIIVMASDSSMTKYFSEHKEYDTIGKSYIMQNNCCVLTWGSIDGNKIGRYLYNFQNSSQEYYVDSIRDNVFEYLKNEYNPKEMCLDDVGYHVGGFTKSGEPKLYHIFWGYDRPRRPDQTHREYKICDHSLHQGDINFLYNGRNDIAESIVHGMLRLFTEGSDVNFRFDNPIDIIRFTDFVVRVGCELTPEVGTPIVIRFLFPENKAGTIINHNLCPLSIDEINKGLSSIE